MSIGHKLHVSAHVFGPLIILLKLVSKKPTSFETDGLIAIVVGFISAIVMLQGESLAKSQ